MRKGIGVKKNKMNIVIESIFCIAWLFVGVLALLSDNISKITFCCVWLALIMENLLRVLTEVEKTCKKK